MTAPVTSRIEVEPGIFLSAATRGDTHKPALVFSNSLAADQHMWDRVIEELGTRRCVITYDTRGHGSSAVPDAALSIARLGEDVIGLLDRLGISKACFCGLSLGGLTGMWLAAHYPDRLSGLVLANTASSFPPASMWQERARTARDEGLASLVDATLERWFTSDFRADHPDVVETVRSMMTATPPEGYAACCEVLGEADVAGDLASIRCPVLVIAGRGDLSTPPEKARAIVEAIGHGDLVELEAAHLSAIERPQEFAEALGQFLDREFGNSIGA